MYFDRDEFALLSRGGRVLLPSQAALDDPCHRSLSQARRTDPGSSACWSGPGLRRSAGNLARVGRSGVRASMSAYGESRDR